VQSVVAGTNVTVDSTDPANPIVSATGGGGSSTFDGLIDVDVYAAVDGDVPIYDSATGTWVAGPQTGGGGGSGGSGGVGVTHVDAPPATPEAEDDEFEGTTLDTAKWAYGADWSAGSVAAEEQVDGAYVIKLNAAGTANEKAYAQVQAGSTYKYRAKVRIFTAGSDGDALDNPANYARIEIFVATDSDNKRVSSVCEWNGGSWYFGARRTTGATYNSGANYVASLIPTTTPPLGLYLEIEDDGTNIYFRASISGHKGTFATFRSESRTTHLGGTADRVGFAVCGAGSGQPVIGVVEWFRKIGSTYAPGAFIANGTSGGTS
jgi:hypothetical protein